MTNPAQQAAKENIVVNRIIDAPLAMVWKAWTDPEQVRRWWGPKDWTSPTCKIDLREGGRYIFCMRAPKEQGGHDSYTTGVYERIVPMERLEFTQILSDKDGNRIEPAQVGLPADFPAEVRIEILFKAKGEFTELNITEFNWTMGQMAVYALAGMHQSMDKLAASLATA